MTQELDIISAINTGISIRAYTGVTNARTVSLSTSCIRPSVVSVMVVATLLRCVALSMARQHGEHEAKAA